MMQQWRDNSSETIVYRIIPAPVAKIWVNMCNRSKITAVGTSTPTPEHTPTRLHPRCRCFSQSAEV